MQWVEDWREEMEEREESWTYLGERAGDGVGCLYGLEESV